MKYEIIIEALKHYRAKVLQDKVINISLDEYTSNQHDRKELYELLKEYSYIDRITESLLEAEQMTTNMSSAVRVPIGHTASDDEYNELIDKYNKLYFSLIDIIR